MNRRTFLAAAGACSLADVDRLLARGDLKGKLSRADLPTPALLLDLDAFEANVAKMTRFARERNRALRPHGKTHKCPEVAKRLIRAGAVGCCAAKLSEAEAFAKEGVTGLLVTTEVVGRHKIERAVRLASRHKDTIFCVDNAQNARDLNEAAGAGRVKLNVAVDLHLGRTGVMPGEPALELARQIVSLPNLKLAGIQAYAGSASHTTGFEQRTRASREAMGKAVETRRLFEAKGIACPLLTGASTGTYNIDSEIDGVTELQPGSFIFMDVDYNKIGGAAGPVYNDFDNALTVLTTVVSKPSSRFAIVDGGFKAFATDRTFGPAPKNIEGISYRWAGDEHGRVDLASPSAPVEVGARIEFIVPHCDPTVNLYDRIYCLRGDAVEAIWPISARGMSQ
ncbi:MAG: DSD1 family PLP-dependent enzyme [Bryobacterales bacterium]|nr:DSD1 family PLP-dependent enzyme [Bryobacterales bacterium]